MRGDYASLFTIDAICDGRATITRTHAAYRDITITFTAPDTFDLTQDGRTIGEGHTHTTGVTTRIHGHRRHAHTLDPILDRLDTH